MANQQILTTLKLHRQLLPILLLTAYCIGAVATAIHGTVAIGGETYDFTLTTKHFIAFGAVIMNLLTYFVQRKFYKYTLTLTIVVGLFNLMTFSALETTQSFSLNSLKISFQPSAFFAGLLAYIINFKRVNNFILDNIRTKQTPEEREKYEKTILAEETETFKERYKNYSNERLTEILAQNKYVPGALEAARYLLNERQIKENAS